VAGHELLGFGRQRLGFLRERRRLRLGQQRPHLFQHPAVPGLAHRRTAEPGQRRQAQQQGQYLDGHRQGVHRHRRAAAGQVGDVARVPAPQAPLGLPGQLAGLPVALARLGERRLQSAVDLRRRLRERGNEHRQQLAVAPPGALTGGAGGGVDGLSQGEL
jgi:hypothetical protein